MIESDAERGRPNALVMGGSRGIAQYDEMFSVNTGASFDILPRCFPLRRASARSGEA